MYGRYKLIKEKNQSFVRSYFYYFSLGDANNIQVYLEGRWYTARKLNYYLFLLLF